jgi:hypothetical protein
MVIGGSQFRRWEQLAEPQIDWIFCEKIENIKTQVNL